jgi:hypothetical protein
LTNSQFSQEAQEGRQAWGAYHSFHLTNLLPFRSHRIARVYRCRVLCLPMETHSPSLKRWVRDRREQGEDCCDVMRWSKQAKDRGDFQTRPENR